MNTNWQSYQPYQVFLNGKSITLIVIWSGYHWFKGIIDLDDSSRNNKVQQYKNLYVSDLKTK